MAEEARRHGAQVVLNPDPSAGPGFFPPGRDPIPGEELPPFFLPRWTILSSPPTTVRSLDQGFAETGAPLVVPAFEGWRGHPVLFGRDLFPELLEEDLPEGARTVVRRYLGDRVQLAVDDPGILADIDTPEEYRKHFP